MKKSLSLIAITVLASVIAGLADAEPDRSEKIRKEYRGSTAPDHIVFAAELLSMKETSATNPDIALWIVQKRMGLDSEEAATAFISRMVAAASEMESEYGKVLDETVCSQHGLRSEALYPILDRVDDLNEIKSHNAYVKFMSELDKSQKEAMTTWLKETKEGFYYRTAEHKSLFEDMGLDVVDHVDAVCTLRRAGQ
jgi:ribosomal protein L35AE/L33A